ncbi:MAG: SDR family oxidoreductase [bacterium]
MSDIPTNIKSRKLVEKRREQIIAAATRLFARKGFHKTTLRNLAEEAGISHGNIYDYIGSKEDILFLIHENNSAQIFKALDSDAEHIRDPLEKLRRMIINEINLSFTWREATLLFYQETKSMQKERLRQLSIIERKRLERFEQVIEECMETGKARHVNPRLISNLIKVMVDVWPLKSWDLTGHTTRHQIEKMILDGVFQGFLQPPLSEERQQSDSTSQTEGAILLINSGKLLGEALVPFLLSMGSRVIFYQKDDSQPQLAAASDGNETPGRLHLYTRSQNGPMGPELYRTMVAACGPIDAMVACWEFGSVRTGSSSMDAAEIDLDFSLSVSLMPEMKQTLGGRGSGRVVHIAPSYWSRDVDTMLYTGTRARIQAMTRQMSLDFGPSGIRVNSIVPGFIDGLCPLEKSGGQDPPVLDRIPLGHLGRLEDLLESVGFLLSDRSRYLTGQILNINGGLT